MAYVLGFWFADGYMRHNKSYKIVFTSKDRRHLADINKICGSNAPITQRMTRGVKEDCYSFMLCSKQMYFNLMVLGGYTCKSKTVAFPKIPIKQLADFIRGYFDGDGSIHLITYKASKNGRFYTEVRSNFTCGSKKFLIVLHNTLRQRLGLAKKIIGQYGPHQFKLGYGKKDTFKLLNFMYYPKHNISLARKRITILLTASSILFSVFEIFFKFSAHLWVKQPKFYYRF
jgi:hypothetical protein